MMVRDQYDVSGGTVSDPVLTRRHVALVTTPTIETLRCFEGSNRASNLNGGVDSLAEASSGPSLATRTAASNGEQPGDGYIETIRDSNLTSKGYVLGKSLVPMWRVTP